MYQRHTNIARVRCRTSMFCLLSSKHLIYSFFRTMLANTSFGGHCVHVWSDVARLSRVSTNSIRNHSQHGHYWRVNQCFYFEFFQKPFESFLNFLFFRSNHTISLHINHHNQLDSRSSSTNSNNSCRRDQNTLRQTTPAVALGTARRCQATAHAVGIATVLFRSNDLFYSFCLLK